MKEEETVEIDTILSLVCRFALWLNDELEPTQRQTLLEDLVDLGVFVQKVQTKAKEWLSSHPISE